MSDRVTLLMSRELDGTMSDLERAELDRKILLRPEARRDRASWKKVISALKEEQPKKLLPMEKMAAQIVAEANQRPAPLPLNRMRRTVLAATLIAAGYGLIALVKPPETVKVSQPAPVAIASESAPVELTVDAVDDDEVAPITTIRF